MPASKPLDDGRKERGDDHRAADGDELIDQLHRVSLVQGEQPHEGLDHVRPVGQEVVQGEDHHQQPEEKLADDLRRSQGHGREPLLHSAR